MNAATDAAVLAQRMTTMEDAIRDHRSDMREQREDIRALTGAVAELSKSVAVLAERVGVAPEAETRARHVAPAAVGGGAAAAVAVIYEMARNIMSAGGH